MDILVCFIIHAYKVSVSSSAKIVVFMEKTKYMGKIWKIAPYSAMPRCRALSQP
jgi:hypothetical protein